MHRRDFAKYSLLMVGRAFMAKWMSSLSAQGKAMPPFSESPSRRIGYIRDAIPSFEIPPYRGQSYDDRVPDTLDIAERARLGINALTSMPDPQAHYEIYWSVNFFRNPPAMLHDFSDWVQYQEGFLEALPLLRLATGENLNDQVDSVWMTAMLKSIGPDGLLYVPLQGRPWGRLTAHIDGKGGVDPVWRAHGTMTKFDDPLVTQFANVSTCARTIGAMTIYYLRDKNPMWKATIEKMIDRLSGLAVHRGDYCYLAMGVFEPGATVAPGGGVMPTGSLWGVSCNSRLIQGLAQYYRLTGYEPARKLARELAVYTRLHADIFDSDGQWLLDPEFRGPNAYPGILISKEGKKLGGHGNGHLIGLLSVVEYAVAVNDRELLAYSKTCFEWGRSPGAVYGVSTRVGWFPEMYVPAYPAADDPPLEMIAIALKLTNAGVADYWDDIDRWVRNHFAEQQFTPAKIDDVRRLSAGSPTKPAAWNETIDRVPERNIGGFSSGVSRNDWALGVTTHGISQCCTGNGTRTLYYVWENIVHHNQGQLRLNLLLNRASPWADIYSYIPYQGRVDLKMKQPCSSVWVRAPEWVETHSPQIACKVNGARRPPHWEGRYLNLGAAAAGDKVELTFRISERTVKEKIGPVTYTLVLKGNTVVSIDPAGKNVPLYRNRDKYRKNEAGWVRVKRFVSDEAIPW